MKFIRLNKATVRCILTTEDLEEYGIGIDDFIEQNDQVSDFIQELLEKAGAEVGNVSQSGMVTLGIMQMPGGKVSITITDAGAEAVWQTDLNHCLRRCHRLTNSVNSSVK